MKLRIHRSCRRKFVFDLLLFLFVVLLAVSNAVEGRWILVSFNVLAAVFAGLAIRFVFQSSELAFYLDEREKEWGVVPGVR